MPVLHAVLETMLRLSLRLVLRLNLCLRADERERGDVPGWVLVTVMTAGLVTALWLIAGNELTRMLRQALSGVTAP